MHVHSFSSILLALPLLSHASAISRGIHRRDLTITTNLPATWTYQGCYEDFEGGRRLVAAKYVNATGMTQESCIAFCRGQNYTVAGVEWGQECYCDSKAPEYFIQKPDYECGTACPGNSAEACGGGGRMSVFASNRTPTPPKIAYAPRGWAYSGCFTDLISARSLPHQVSVQGAMTVPSCLAACSAAGYVMAGVEYSNECFCGNQLSERATLAAGETCSMRCAGDPMTKCGGGLRMNVYQVSSGPGFLPPTCIAVPNNCYIDNSYDNRTLSHRAYVDEGALTVRRCLQTCVGLGYKYSGLEYSDECWCGSVLNGSPAPDGQVGCNSNCYGNLDESCGGAWHLNVYQCQV